jgi:FkbM family methyltransferase
MNYDYALPYIDKEKVSLIFELGARDCKDSVALQKQYNCPVYAFECNPDGIVQCHETLKGYKQSIELIEKAVNIYDGETLFYPFDPRKHDNIGASSLFHHKTLWDVQKQITVPCCRLDTFIQERGLRGPDLLCMDIQGAEMIAMKSMGEFLRDVRYVATEASIEGCYKESYTFKDIYTFMNEQGFELVFSPYSRKAVLDFIQDVTEGKGETDFVWERI